MSKKKKKPKAPKKSNTKKDSRRRAKPSRASAPRGPVQKIASVTQFKRSVLGANKPVLVDFWAPWCGPCKALAPIFKEVAEENSDDFLFFKVNTEEVPAVSDMMNIRSIPTMVGFYEGDVVDMKMGVAPKEQIVNMLKRMKKKAEDAQAPEAEESTEAATPASEKKGFFKKMAGLFGG